MSNTMGIVSLKGGVGKTSVVSSLGSALASFGKKVLLVDANFSAPNLGLHWNLPFPEITLHDVLERKAHPKDAIYSVRNVDIMPSAIHSKSNVNYLKLKDKLKYLKKKYDFILVDSSPALNEETLAAMLASDRIFVVTTSDYSSLSTTVKSLKLARQRGTKVDGLILNKFHNKSFELNLEDIEKTTEIPIMAIIPYDVNHLKANSEFVSYVDYKPNSKGSDEYKKLACALIGQKYRPFQIKRFFRINIPKKQEINRTIFYHNVLR